jgi:hypothetical protein
MGIYAWISNSNAGALLGSTYEQIVTSATPAWYTLTLKSPVTIVSGTKYFIVRYGGNATGGGKMYTYYTVGSANGIHHSDSGLTYPTFLNPLTGESGNNNIYSGYSSYFIFDQNKHYTAPSWNTVVSGWNSFENSGCVWRNITHLMDDFTGDGLVNGDDLAELIGHYGD